MTDETGEEGLDTSQQKFDAMYRTASDRSTQGRYYDAGIYYEQALAIKYDPDVCLHLADIYMRQLRFKEALEVLHRAEEDFKNAPLRAKSQLEYSIKTSTAMVEPNPEAEYYVKHILNDIGNTDNPEAYARAAEELLIHTFPSNALSDDFQPLHGEAQKIDYYQHYFLYDEIYSIVRYQKVTDYEEVRSVLLKAYPLVFVEDRYFRGHDLINTDEFAPFKDGATSIYARLPVEKRMMLRTAVLFQLNRHFARRDYPKEFLSGSLDPALTIRIAGRVCYITKEVIDFMKLRVGGSK